MNEFPHEGFDDELASYVLGALPEAEARRFEAHLSGCGRCQEELARLQPAADALSRSVPQVAPPESLKRNLMETVRADAKTAAQPAGGRWSWPRLRVPALAASAALAVGLAIGIGASELADDERSAREIAAEVDAERLADAEGTLTVPADGSRSATLRMSNLPGPGPGRVYEVWVSSDGRVRPASLFEPTRDGNAVAGIGAPLEDADAVLVTREQRGGAATPSEDPVIAIPL